MIKEWTKDPTTQLIISKLLEETVTAEEELKRLGSEGSEGEFRFCAGKIAGLEALGHIIDEMENE